MSRRGMEGQLSVKIAHSALYMLKVILEKQLKMNESMQAQIDDAKEQYEEYAGHGDGDYYQSENQETMMHRTHLITITTMVMMTNTMEVAKLTAEELLAQTQTCDT